MGGQRWHWPRAWWTMAAQSTGLQGSRWYNLQPPLSASSLLYNTDTCSPPTQGNHLYPILSLLFFGSTGFELRTLCLQVRHSITEPLPEPFAPELFFRQGLSFLPGAGLGPRSSNLHFLCSWDDRCTPPRPACLLRWGLEHLTEADTAVSTPCLPPANLGAAALRPGRWGGHQCPVSPPAPHGAWGTAGARPNACGCRRSEEEQGRDVLPILPTLPCPHGDPQSPSCSKRSWWGLCAVTPLSLWAPKTSRLLAASDPKCGISVTGARQAGQPREDPMGSH
jgi:hypothetical protein